MKKYYEKIMGSFEVLSKIVGGVAALIAVLGSEYLNMQSWQRSGIRIRRSTP